MHFASFILCPSILVFNFKQDKDEQKIYVTKEEKKKGLEFIKEKCGSGFLAINLIFSGKQELFQKHDKTIFFYSTIVETISNSEW